VHAERIGEARAHPAPDRPRRSSGTESTAVLVAAGHLKEARIVREKMRTASFCERMLVGVREELIGDRTPSSGRHLRLRRHPASALVSGRDRAAGRSKRRSCAGATYVRMGAPEASGRVRIDTVAAGSTVGFGDGVFACMRPCSLPSVISKTGKVAARLDVAVWPASSFCRSREQLGSIWSVMPGRAMNALSAELPALSSNSSRWQCQDLWKSVGG